MRFFFFLFQTAPFLFPVFIIMCLFLHISFLILGHVSPWPFPSPRGRLEKEGLAGTPPRPAVPLHGRGSPQPLRPHQAGGAHGAENT